VAVFCKSWYQQEIKAISPSTLQFLCVVLISVIIRSSMANQSPGNNWRFWSNAFLIVPNTPIISGTIFVITFHILLTLISRSLYLDSFSVSFVLTFESTSKAISISTQVFSYLPCSSTSGQFACIVGSVTGMSHIIVVYLAFMTLSGICPQYLSVTCNSTSLGCNQPPYCVY